jgi:hypothetical protein
MIDLFKQFDTYSLKARVFPALVAGLPILALLFVLVPWDHLGLPEATKTNLSQEAQRGLSDFELIPDGREAVSRFQALPGCAGPRLSTDEIIALTRSEGDV